MSCAIFDPEAEAEFAEAVEFLLRLNAEAAIRFAESVSAACELLLENPELGERWRLGVRRKRLLRFEYYIYYKPIDDGIFIVAVAHQKRKPGYFRERLRP